MIKFTLVCEDAHDFESWFSDGAAYDTQVKRGLVVCPVCNSVRVSKAMMAPALVRRGSLSNSSRSGTGNPAPARAAESGSADAGGDTAPAQPVVLIDERHRKLHAMMQHMRNTIIENSVDVGRRFPDEARRMHDGDIPVRSIRGEASPEEARALVEDGVEILPLPPAPKALN